MRLLSVDDGLDRKLQIKVVKAIREGKSISEIFVDPNLDSISLQQIKEIQLLVQDEAPVMRLESLGTATAPILNYNVPDSTSYMLQSYIILRNPFSTQLGDPDLPKNWFIFPPSSEDAAYKDYIKDHQTYDKEAFKELLTLIIEPKLGSEAVETYFNSYSQTYFGKEIHPKIIDHNYRLRVDITSAGTPVYDWTSRPGNPQPKIMLVERYMLTSFLGDYGAGRTVKTFTLLPGEKTKISIKTWKTTELNAKQASSILDSWSAEASNSFETSLQNENTDRQQTEESTEWHFDANAKAKGGIDIKIINMGSEYGASGGIKSGSSTVRENIAKNVSSATLKQVYSATSKRNVEVNTSFESKETFGQENLLEREFENVNVGRVLNFVFRQLHQEYITYLHLTDVRLAITNGEIGNALIYKEYSLGQIEDLLNKRLDDTATDPSGNSIKPRNIVREIIVNELTNIYDLDGIRREFIECIDIETGKRVETGTGVSDPLKYLDPSSRLDPTGRLKLYLRKKKKQSELNNETPGKIDGIIITRNRYVLPTDSLIVEALLGQTEALDKYSIESRKAIIDLKQANIDKLNLAKSIVNDEDAEKADIFAKVYPPKVKIGRPPPTPTP